MSKTRILFISRGDSSRSQMAKGWCELMHSNTIEAFSAGIDPTGVSLLAYRVMWEVGVDIDSYSSKSIEQFESAEFDLVILLDENVTNQCGTFIGCPKFLTSPF